MNSKKYNLVLPVAGEANRFKEAGYLMPKPMIPCNNKTVVEYALNPFNLEEANIIFIVQKKHVADYSIDSFLRQKFGDGIAIVELDKPTEGALCTCLFSEPYIDYTLPLVIYTPDVTFSPKFVISDFDRYEAALLTFKANSPDHSYAKLNDNGLVVETKEKEVISDNAAAGLYFFKTPSKFYNYGMLMMQRGEKVKQEYYICPVYNYFIKDRLDVGVVLSEKLYVLGTPKELEFYERHVLHDTFRIGLCSDHSGFAAKEIAKQVLESLGIKYIDFGAFSAKDCDYNSYVKQAALRLNKRYVDLVIGFCRTGQGVNICANKIEGIRACIMYNEYSCEYAIRHNCCNFFSFPSKNFTGNEFTKYVGIMQRNKFDGGRHYTRISDI